MKVAVIGTSTIGAAYARALVEMRYEVVTGGRGPGKAAALAQEIGAKAFNTVFAGLILVEVAQYPPRNAGSWAKAAVLLADRLDDRHHAAGKLGLELTSSGGPDADLVRSSRS